MATATAAKPADYITVAQERTLDALKQSQAVVLEVVETWAGTVAQNAPDLPAIPVPKGLPSPESLVNGTFDFYGKVLSAQHDFAKKLIAASAPALKTTEIELPKA
ncbi:MAG: hypothetical protein AB7V42_06650 [Thermoleophilia bacterium]